MTPTAAPDIRATNRIFEEEVVGKGDFGALSRVYTHDARILPPGTEMITGLEPIKAFWKGAAAALGVTGVKLTTVEMEFLSDTAVEIGRATLNPGQASAVDVKYVVVWKKEDGSWKWHIDIWNAVS